MRRSCSAASAAFLAAASSSERRISSSVSCLTGAFAAAAGAFFVGEPGDAVDLDGPLTAVLDEAASDFATPVLETAADFAAAGFAAVETAGFEVAGLDAAAEEAALAADAEGFVVLLAAGFAADDIGIGLNCVK